MAFVQPSLGYDGTVSETGIARMSRYFGADYGVGGPNDWKVTAVAGQDRTVAIAAGQGYGHFVLDTTDSIATLQLGTIASGSRWDLVACRRDWQPPGGTSIFAAVAGTSSQLIPSGRFVGPGVKDDQPLALVQVTAGQTLPTAIIDLRTWPSKVFTANDLLALPNAAVGTEAVVGTTRYRRVLDNTGNVAWVVAGVDAGWVTSGFKVSSGWTNGGSRVRLKDGVVQFDLRVSRTSTTAINVSGTGGIADTAVITVPATYAPNGLNVVTGGSYSNSGSYGATYMVGTDGVTFLQSGTPNVDVVKGSNLSATFTYLL